MQTTTARPKADLSRAGLLNRLDARLHEAFEQKAAKEISAREYRETRAYLLNQMEVIARIMPA